MLKRLVAAAVVVAGLAAPLAVAAPASAAGQFCYNLTVNANGSNVVDQADCQALPV